MQIENYIENCKKTTNEDNISAKCLARAYTQCLKDVAIYNSRIDVNDIANRKLITVCDKIIDVLDKYKCSINTSNSMNSKLIKSLDK